MGRLWKVVGGEDKGGILIRKGQATSSAQEPERLSCGATVEELEHIGERLHYKLVTGTGPAEGWASVKVSGKELLVPDGGEPAAAAPKAAAKAPGATPPKDEGSYWSWMAEFKERYGHIMDQVQPPMPEAMSWSKDELGMFFESGGSIMPARSRPRPAPATASPSKAATPKAKSSSAASPKVPQLPVTEALKVQEALKKAFGASDLQRKLKDLKDKFPKYKERNHEHGILYFEAFETLALSVYQKVLPTCGLSGDWDGVSDLHARLKTAMATARVKKLQEEINTLLGLPRDAEFRPRKKTEDAFAYRPTKDGNISDAALPLVRDEDGDEGHEFLVEDRATGELRTAGPSALSSASKPASAARRR